MSIKKLSSWNSTKKKKGNELNKTFEHEQKEKNQILSQILSQMELGSLALDLKAATQEIPDRQTN